MIRSALRRTAIAAASLAVFASGSLGTIHASPGVSVSTTSLIGHAIVTDDRGLTLYRFTRDQGGASSCYDWCARTWPPVLVDGVPVTDDPTLAANLGTTVRTDGSLQLTFDGTPLYYYVGDGQPGDTNGQGSAGLWFVVDAPSQ